MTSLSLTTSSFEALLRGRLARARAAGNAEVVAELEGVLADYGTRVPLAVQHRDPSIVGAR